MAEYEWILVLRVAAGMGLTYLLIPLVIFSLLLSWNPIPRNRFPLFIIACFGIGPMLCSWLCQMIAWAVPGATPATCVAVVGSLAVLGTCVAAWRAQTVRNRLRETFSGFTHNDRRRLLRETLIVVGVLAVGALAWFAAWTQIIRNSDYVYYLTNARFFFDGVPVSSYPFHHPAEPTDYYFPSMHPLGYHFLLYWSYALQGTAETTLLARSVGAFYFTMTGLLAWAVARRTGWVAALFAPLLLLSVRIFCVKAAEGGPIDAMRIFFDCLTVYLALEAATSQNRKVLLAAGLSLGFALNSHSIGFLMVVFAPMVYFVFGMRMHPKLGWKRISLQALVPLAIAFFICGAHYVNNTLSTGKPVGDDTLVWDALGTQARDIFRHARGLSTPGERISNGLLAGWTNTDTFGKSYWIMLGAILLFPRKLIRNPAALAALTMLAMFFTLAVTSVVLGSDLIVKNPRYMQTIQPYVAIVAAIGLQYLLTSLIRLSILRQLPLTAGMRIAWRLIRPFSKFSFRLSPVWLKMNRLAARAVLTAGLIALAYYATDAARKYPYNYWARIDRADILSELAFQGDLAAMQAAPAAPDAEFYAYVEEHVPSSATLLLYYEDAFRFYLKERRVIGHYNPHLLPLLSMQSPEEAFSFLERNGVDYVVVNPWLPPALTCSVMSQVVSDPRYCELQTDMGGYRLFRLKRRPLVEQRLIGVVTPTLTAAGKATAAIESEADLREPPPQICLASRQTYVLSCEGTGEGLATIILSAGATGGKAISPIQIWEGLIEREGRAINLQFELPSIAANEGGVVEDVRFTVRLAGDGGVISPIRISEVRSQPKGEPKVARQEIIDRLDRRYPGRGVLDYPGNPVGDNPKAYAMLLKGELAFLSQNNQPCHSELVRTCGRWLLAHSDINQDSVVGWGLPSAWDAFNDGTENPADTSYTITTAIVIDALLDWIEIDPTAPKERILEVVSQSFQPYFQAENISPSGLAPYSLSSYDRPFNCFNPAIYLAGQAQRFAGIENDENLRQQLKELADRNVAVAIENRLLSPTKRWYWSYSLEEDVPNDIPHASYIIHGLQEYIRHGGRMSARLDEPAILAHLKDFELRRGISWSAWPSFDRTSPSLPRTYGLGMALYLASRNGMRDEAGSMLRLLLSYAGKDCLYVRPNSSKVINEYQAYAFLGLSCYEAHLAGDHNTLPLESGVEPTASRIAEQLTRTDLSQPLTIPFVEMIAGDSTYKVEIDVTQLSTSLVSTSRYLPLPPQLIPLAAIDANKERLLVFTRHLWSSRLGCYLYTSDKQWADIALPPKLEKHLFRIAVRFDDSVVLITYDAIENRNLVHRLTIAEDAIVFDTNFHETLRLNAYLGYEHQPRILAVDHGNELLLAAGPCVARYSSVSDAPVLRTDYLESDVRILEVAANEKQAFALVQAGNRSDHLNEPDARQMDPKPQFSIINLETKQKVRSLPPNVLPFGLEIIENVPQVRLVKNGDDLAELFQKDLRSSKAGGMMSLGINNREGEVVWSQGYWLTGMIDFLSATDQMAGGDALQSLRPQIKQRLDIEMALLDRLLMEGPGLDCEVFAVARVPSRFAVQSGKTHLLLKRYLLSPAPIALKSFSAFGRQTALLEGHIEVLAQNQGEEPELARGRYYLRWPKGVPFKYDGVGVPFNHQNCWAAGLLFHEELTQLNRQQSLAARDIAFQVYDTQGFRQRTAQRNLRNAREDAYHWHYWWGRARNGWRAGDDVSKNSPNWKGDGVYTALNRYRTFDAIAMLAAHKRFPDTMPTWLIDYFSQAVQDEGLELFLIPYLAEHGRYPDVDPNSALYYVRVDSQPDFRNSFWAYRVIQESLNQPYSRPAHSTDVAKRPNGKQSR